MARSLVVEEGLQNELAVPSVPQTARDEIPTFWIAKNDIHEAIRSLRYDVPDPYKLLYDVTAIDERARTHRRSAIKGFHRGLPPLLLRTQRLCPPKSRAQRKRSDASYHH